MNTILEDGSIDESTSPAQLQDVTMDNSYAMGYRSPPFNVPLPGGSTSPGQGRSIREQDEQLNALRKENFNLKLRIYFMEEKNTATTVPDSSESLFKENVDLKVQTEALRVELKEKQNLLCEAATALELMEQSQKSREDACQTTIDELNTKIQFLEMDIQTMEKQRYNSNYGDYHRESTVDTFNFQLETDVKKESSAQLDDTKYSQSTETEQLLKEKQLEAEMWQKKYDHVSEELRVLTEKISTIEETSFEKKNSIHSNNDSTKELAEKDCIIITLEDALKEKSSALDKAYKSIQYLTKKIKTSEQELSQLRDNSNVEGKSTDNVTSQNLVIENLKSELSIAHHECEEAHKWRQDCADVCGMLTLRLKELAEFLDSLLKHKDIMGVLAQDRRKAIRKAVDKSLDLSNSLNNISLSMTGRFSLNESNFNVSSLSDILNLSLDNKENQRRFNLDESNCQAMLIEMLRAEVQNLKKEAEKNAKKERKSFPLSIEPTSDSEAWSEPDRNVSHARIGLEESSKFNNGKSNHTLNNGSKSTTASEDDMSKLSRKNSGLKYQERIAELELLIAERDNQILKAQCTLVDTDKRLKEEHSKLLNISKDLHAHQNVNEMLEIEIIEFKSKVQQDLDEINRLNSLLSEKSATIEKLISERDESDVNLRVADMKLKTLLADLEELKSYHSQHINEIMATQTKDIDFVKRDLFEKHQSELVKNWISKNIHEETLHQLESTIQRLSECDTIIDSMKESEAELNEQIIEAEKNIRLLRKSLDETSLQASKATVERTKAMSEKLALEKLNSELMEKIDEAVNMKIDLNSRIGYLEKANAELQNTLVVNDSRYKLTKSASQGNARYLYQLSDQSQSECTSDEARLHHSNPSPDLGIESDALRTSGSDGHFPTKLREVTASVGNILLEDDEEGGSTTKESASNDAIVAHNCTEVDKENAELKRKLIGTHKAYTNILAQLKISNSRKEQVERDIRREICKTQNVLKNVRTNIESVAKNSANGYKSDHS